MQKQQKRIKVEDLILGNYYQSPNTGEISKIVKFESEDGKIYAIDENGSTYCTRYFYEVEQNFTPIAASLIGTLRNSFKNSRYQLDLSVSSFIGNKDLTKEIVRQIVGEEVPFNKYTLSNVSNLLAAHFQQYSLF